MHGYSCVNQHVNLVLVSPCRMDYSFVSLAGRCTNCPIHGGSPNPELNEACFGPLFRIRLWPQRYCSPKVTKVNALMAATVISDEMECYCTWVFGGSVRWAGGLAYADWT